MEQDILKSRDAHFLPEYEIALISERGSVYEYRLDDNKYPFDEIYGAASLSGYRGPEIAREQINLLHSKNKIVRYWAILGLRSQPASIIHSFKLDILSAMSDPYPPVSVIANAIAFQNFQDVNSEKRLKEYCQNENQHIALMAINLILYIEDKEPFIETIKKVYDKPGNPYTIKAACLDFLGILKLVPNDFEHAR